MRNGVIAAFVAGVIVATVPANADSKKPGKTVVTDTKIEILDQISFSFGSKVVIQPESFPTLDALAATLKGNPELALVEVQAHTDERGDAAWNLKLSQLRAEAIVSALIQRGVEAKRLRAKGYGESQPLDRGHNPKAWARNRRIAFLILQRVT